MGFFSQKMPLQQANFTVLDVFRPKNFFSPNHGGGVVKATGGEGMGGGGRGMGGLGSRGMGGGRGKEAGGEGDGEKQR